MEVFRGECNFSQSSGVRRKGKSSTGGVRILNAIAQWSLHLRMQVFLYYALNFDWAAAILDFQTGRQNLTTPHTHTELMYIV